MLALNLYGAPRSCVPELGPVTADRTNLGTTERLCDAVNEMVEKAPTLFGRLELLARLQDTSDDDLPLPLLPSCTSREFRRAVEITHLDLLYQWLSRSWELRIADTRIHYTRLGREPRRLITRALETESYRQLLPPQADPSHREHFLLDMRILLNLVNGSFE